MFMSSEYCEKFLLTRIYYEKVVCIFTYQAFVVILELLGFLGHRTVLSISIVLMTVRRTVQCGAENDIDRARWHGLSIEVAVRSNSHACVRSELLKWTV